jgi:hypothetical protein
MVDYYPLIHPNRNIAEPDPEEAQADPEPLLVECVYNELEEHNGTTIAIKVSFRVPRHRPGIRQPIGERGGSTTMFNHSSIPQRTKGLAQTNDIEAVVRQAVQAAVQAALPQSLHAQQIVFRLNITVNIYLPS